MIFGGVCNLSRVGYSVYNNEFFYEVSIYEKTD